MKKSRLREIEGESIINRYHRMTENGHERRIPSTLGETVDLVLDDGTTVTGRVTSVNYIWTEGSMYNPKVKQVVSADFGDISLMMRYGLYLPGKKPRSRWKWVWSSVLTYGRSGGKPGRQKDTR